MYEYREEKMNTKIRLVNLLIVLLLVCPLLSCGIIEKTKTADNVSATENERQGQVESAFEEESITASGKESIIETEKESESFSEQTTSSQEETSLQESVSDEQTEITETETMQSIFAELYADDIDVRCATDYAHISSDGNYFTLGTGEELTIDINAPGTNVIVEDFIIIFEEDKVNAVIDEPQYDDDSTTIRIHIVGTVPGSSEVIIVTSYEWEQKEDESSAYVFTVNQLNAERGQIVYVTQTGSKYHFSSDCAGQSSYATTLKDAEGVGYEPCAKCTY